MRNVIYTLIFLLVLFTLFRGVIFDILDSFNISLPQHSSKVFISKDGGLSWEERKLKKNNFSDVFFDKENSGNLLLASNIGILKMSRDKEVLLNKDKNKNKKFGYIFGVFQDDFFPDAIYLISFDIGGSKVFYSDDKGENFRLILKLDNHDKILSFTSKGDNLYVGTKNGILLSSKNRGTSWQKIKDFSPQSIISLAINKKNDELYILLSSKLINILGTEPPKELTSKVFVLKNGKFFEIQKLRGKEIKRAITNSLGEVYFISNDEVYFYLNGVLLKINLISDFKITDFTIDPKNPNILYVASRNLLYRSRDKGKTWEVINLPQGIQRIGEIEINPNNSNEILIKVSQ